MNSGVRVRPALFLPSLPPLGRLIAWTTAVGALCYLVRALVELDSWSYAMVWPAVAPQLVALLTAPRRQWPVYLAAFAAVQIVPARLVLGIEPEIGIVATMTAVVLAAAVLHRDQDWVSGRSDSLRSWQRFLWYGVFIGPLLASPLGVAGLVLHGQIGTDVGTLAHALVAWFLTEAVGIAFLVPLMLRWSHFRQPHSWRELTWFAALTAVNVALHVGAMATASFVLLFLSGLPALLILIRSGIAATFGEMAVGSAIALGGTFLGHGPFVMSGSTPEQALTSMQVFVLAAYAMVVVVAAALEDRMRLAALDTASYEAYDMVAELTGDIVLLVDRDGQVLRHASPGYEILDLPPGRVDKTAWLGSVHPDDRAARESLPAATPAGPSNPFRIRRRDGTWGWYVVHSRRTAAGLTAVLLRDVTLEREVQDTLTDMAHTDPLTGLANRRGLALRAGEIWQRAAEVRTRVSALFVDLDHFKAFNDLYGHQAGDECLRHVAGVLAHLADDTVCVAARYGGEEFAVVVSGDTDPGTFAHGLATAIRALQIPHLASVTGTVTVSVGVATLSPRPGADHVAGVDELLNRADKALYAAKSAGRDAVSVYDEAVGLPITAARRADSPSVIASGLPRPSRAQ
jgi:diguanylate cyclase (GGDEF)-like protein